MQFEIEKYWEEKVESYQWKSSDNQTELATMISKRGLLEIAAKLINNLILHDFIARKKGLYLQEMKESLPSNKVIVLMDFAMNFTCLYQNEILSYHWSKKQVHPLVILYKGE